MQPDVHYVSCGDGYVAYARHRRWSVRPRPDLRRSHPPRTRVARTRSASGASAVLPIGRGSSVATSGASAYPIASQRARQSTIASTRSTRCSTTSVPNGPRCSVSGRAARWPCAFAAAHPERTAALVLYGSGPRNTAAPDYDLLYDRALAEAALRDGSRALGRYRPHSTFGLIAPSRADDPAFRRWFAELQRLGCSPGQYLESAILGARHRRPRHPSFNHGADARPAPAGRSVLPDCKRSVSG